MSENRIYPYPKTSCSCYFCSEEEYKFPTGHPTNLSVRDNKVSKYYDCHNHRNISSKIQPSIPEKTGYLMINPQAYTENYSVNFQPVESTCCPETQYFSRDPRLWSGTHAQYTTFSHPPIDHTTKLKDIYDKKLKYYGKGYKTYSDISAGNIVYYIDKSQEDAYYKPLFSHPAETQKRIYVDPMGGVKPEYPRSIHYNNPINDTTFDNDPFCLSFIKDTQNHRQDILAANMSKINQQRWEPRWS
jgi:hypothetical protein